MASKKDKKDLMEKYGPMLKRLGEDLDKGAKRGKEEVIKMSKLVGIQMDILSLALQKEKLFYDIGKEVAEKMLKDVEAFPELGKYRKRLSSIETKSEKDRKTLSRVGKTRKNRSTVKKKQRLPKGE